MRIRGPSTTLRENGTYPYPYSASILRHELDGIEKRFPLRKKMVVIGHSMGGCISRLLITDTDEKLWMILFKKPPEQVPLSPESKKLLPMHSSLNTARKWGAWSLFPRHCAGATSRATGLDGSGRVSSEHPLRCSA